MEKYLYLTKFEWANAWLSGGKIPASLASSYLFPERSSTRTPDENLIYDSPINLKAFRPIINVEDRVNIKGLTISGTTYNGMKMPDVHNVNHYREDGLILSFCNIFSEEIALKLGKSTCIKILDMEKLKKKIDKQIGCRSVMAECTYTSGHQRSHFLKHTDDSWQNEFRIFWKSSNQKWVTVPKNIAVLVRSFN